MLEVQEKIIFQEIKEILQEAKNKVYKVANNAMVEAYWNIGRVIVEKQGGKDKAEYGTALLKNLSKEMTKEFGKGFTLTNLKYMRQFYLNFPKSHALSDQLSWTHYRLLMRVENENARNFYLEESIKENWSTRQLDTCLLSICFLLLSLLHRPFRQYYCHHISKLLRRQLLIDHLSDQLVINLFFDCIPQHLHLFCR